VRKKKVATLTAYSEKGGSSTPGAEREKREERKNTFYVFPYVSREEKRGGGKPLPYPILVLTDGSGGGKKRKVLPLFHSVS